jgi:predicted ATP-grasp superfamily ATP-dependent carboligase
VYAIGKDIGPGASKADHFENIDFNIEKIRNLIKREDIRLIYSVGSDIAMPICSYLSEELELPHFVSAETALICNNKIKMRESLGQDFEGNLQYKVLRSQNELDDLLPYPFIMKPSDSQGQRGVRLIRSVNELMMNFGDSQKYSRDGRVIIEEYICGHEISVNGYLYNGNLIYYVISDRLVWPQYQAGLVMKHIIPSDKINNDKEKEIIRIFTKAAKKLGIYNGPIYSQMKLKDDKIYIIEITPRWDGCHLWRPIYYLTGINFLKTTFIHLIDNACEVGNIKKKYQSRYELCFLYDKPFSRVDYTKFDIPYDAIYSFRYYNDGDLIRPVNGIFEKIGYYIKEIK